jgi:hypothetical protein
VVAKVEGREGVLFLLSARAWFCLLLMVVVMPQMRQPEGEIESRKGFLSGMGGVDGSD